MFGEFHAQATEQLRAWKYPWKMSLLVISNGDIAARTSSILKFAIHLFSSLSNAKCRSNYTTGKHCYSGMPTIRSFLPICHCIVCKTHLEAWFSCACTSLYLFDSQTICQVTLKEPSWLFRTITLYLVNTLMAHLVNTWPMHVCLYLDIFLRNE